MTYNLFICLTLWVINNKIVEYSLSFVTFILVNIKIFLLLIELSEQELLY